MAAQHTTYDDVFRTILNDCRDLIHPLLNEIFGEHYSGREPIHFGTNEHFMNQRHGQGDKRITDSSFTVSGIVLIRYHLECQSTGDATMDRRMFEYDSQIALDNSEKLDDSLVLSFPKSAVLFLRQTAGTPDNMQIRLKLHNTQKEVTLEIPILSIVNYTADELFQKNLLILLPFHLFYYEKQFPKMEQDTAQRGHLKELYGNIRLRLEEMARQGTITEYTCRTILDLCRRIAESLCQKYDNIRKEIISIMGGEILEYEAKTILNEGKKQGWILGRESGLAEGHKSGLAEGLSEGHKSGLAEGLSTGRMTTYLELVKEGILNIKDAARRIPMDEAEFLKLLDSKEPF